MNPIRHPSRLIRTSTTWSRYNIFPFTCIRSMRKWFGNYLYFSKATMCIRGLVFSHSFANHAIISILIVYLTNNWKDTHFQIAAIVMNVQEGVSDIMVLVLARISHAYKNGGLKVIVTTNAAYLLGLLLLWICARYMSSDTAAKIFYGAVVLLALGEAGRSATLREFLDNQYLSEQKHTSCTNEEQRETRTEALWDHPWFLGALAPLFLTILYWERMFLVSTILMGVSYLLFLFLFGYYYFISNRSPIVSEQESHLECPEKLSIPSCPVEQEPRKRELRRATRVTSFHVEAAQRREVKLCPTEEAKRGKFWTPIKVKEEYRFFIEVLVMWSALFIYSLVEATGSTFFFEQMSNLEYHIGSFKVHEAYFTVLSSFSSWTISHFYDLLVPQQWRHATLVRIGCGLACSMLCCIAAWQVEMYRLGEIEGKGLQDDDDTTTISMSICWLAPQFLLLGLMKGLALEGVIRFFVDRVEDDDKLRSMYYASHINDFVLGIGKLFTALSILVFREIWFADYINWSHLDNCYKALTISSAVNVIYYVCICFYFYSNDKSRRSANRENQETSALMEEILEAGDVEMNADKVSDINGDEVPLVGADST